MDVPHLLGEEEVVDKLLVLRGCAESRQGPELRDQFAVILETKKTQQRERAHSTSLVSRIKAHTTGLCFRRIVAPQN